MNNENYNILDSLSDNDLINIMKAYQGDYSCFPKLNQECISEINKRINGPGICVKPKYDLHKISPGELFKLLGRPINSLPVLLSRSFDGMHHINSGHGHIIKDFNKIGYVRIFTDLDNEYCFLTSRDKEFRELVEKKYSEDTYNRLKKKITFNASSRFASCYYFPNNY